MGGVKELISGPAFLFGEDIDTDIIIPARYLDTTDARELASHCMEPLRPGFAAEAGGGGIVVAGANFGCGSSREHAPVALMGCGITGVVAESLARIFYRNCINRGLPTVVCPGVAAMVSEGDVMEIDLPRGRIVNKTTGMEMSFDPLPPFMMDILSAGGLMSYLKKNQLSF